MAAVARRPEDGGGSGGQPRMMEVVRSTIAACLVLLVAPAASQPAPGSFRMAPIPAPAEPDAIPLHAAGIGSATSERWAATLNGKRIVRNVTRPTVTPFLPKAGSATGAAVIVAPGGGYAMLAWDHEGTAVARSLADRGIAAFLLKYRLNQTPQDQAEFQRMMGARMAAIAAGGPPPSEPRAVADALQAIRFVRSNAGRWGIDADRVGLIGFSAGARTAVAAATAPNAERPSFIASIYGAMKPLNVPADAPALFTAIALDDSLYGRDGFGIVESWQRAGRPVELHAYERGQHGFGLGLPGTTTTLMMDQFIAWLDSRGLLAGAKK